MRFVPAEQLRVHMVLGQDLFDARGKKLLAKDIQLNEDTIQYLIELGIPGIYVDDAISKDITVQEIVAENVKCEATSLIREVFIKTMDDQMLQPEERLLQLVVKNVVDHVLSNKEVMYNMVDIKNYQDYTYFHSLNVGVLAGVIGAKMDLSNDELNDLVTAGFLHDIGKTFVFPEAIQLERRMSPEEREQMKNHCELGANYLRKEFSFSERVIQAVLQHHEWYNGQGYPNHAKGTEICKIARILRAADLYDALTSKKPYRSAYVPGEVMEYIMARNGMEFDPSVVEVMASQLCIYPVGSEVVLSNGRHAIVVANHRGFIGRPTVRLVDTGEEFNLRSDRAAYNITITQLLI